MASTFKRRTASRGSSSVIPSDLPPAVKISSSSNYLSSNGKPFLPGTKPWTTGLVLTSTGLRELDTVLSSSGQPIGTCIWLEEDRWSNHLAQCLIQYWCAEALCQGQELVCPFEDDEMNKVHSKAPLSWTSSSHGSSSINQNIRSPMDSFRELLQTLPRNLNLDKQLGKQRHYDNLIQTENDRHQPLDVLYEAGDDEQESEAAEESLEIAWQYSKAVQQQRSGLSSKSSNRNSAMSESFCHSYDLNGRLCDQIDVIGSTRIISISFESEVLSHNALNKGLHYFHNLTKQLQSILVSKPNTVIRLLFYQPSDIQSFSVMLPLFLAHIRENKIPAVVLVAARSWVLNSSVSAISLKRTCDVVLQTESFASRREYPPPSEFRMLHGLLHVHKVSTVTSSIGHFADITVTKQPTAYLYGLKRDQRKLHIQLLHIPPEDYASAGGSVGGGGVRSNAGRPAADSNNMTQPNRSPNACASGGGKSLLDF